MTKLIPWGVGVALLISLWQSYEGWQRDKRMDQLVGLVEDDKALKQAADSQRAVVDSGTRDLDTVRIPQWRTAYRTVTITDTVEVRAALELADTTIRACRRVLGDCARLSLVEKARADSMEKQRDIWKGLARGPLVALTGEGAYEPSSGAFYGAADASVRLPLPGAWRAFGRVEQRLVGGADSTRTSLRVGLRRAIRLF